MSRSHPASWFRVAGVGAFIALAPGWAAPPQAGQAASRNTVRKPALHVPKVNRPPHLSDFINNLPRENEVEISDFVQNQPGDGKPVSRPTTAYLSYDSQNLYVVFVCQEQMGAVRTGMAKREDLGDNDTVSIYLDTFHDRQRAYVFSVNALGVQRDAVLTEGAGTDTRFDAVWRSEGRLTDAGFVVWMAIPFKSLRFLNADPQIWGVALGRSFIRNNEVAYWPYITKREAGFVRQMADMEGLQGVSSAKDVELIPYVTGAHDKLLGADGQYQPQTDTRVGLDSKVVMRDSVTLDVTLNPDFSQVESDDPQVTINQRFEVFFPEKRPFFLENAGFFQSPMNLFFSRRIADPEFGARLTGKIGRWAFGALAADDRAPGNSQASSSSLFQTRAIDGAFRVQREFGEQSTIGFLATDREFGSNSNRVAALDTRLKLSPNWYFRGQIVHSYDRQTGGRKLDGPGSFAELSHEGRHFTYTGTYSDLSPDFRARLGFIQRVDIRRVENYAGYYWWPQGSRFLSVGLAGSTAVNWDRQGRLQDWYANAEWSVDLTGSTGFKLTRYEGFELIDPYRLRYHKSGISFYTSGLKKITLYGSFSRGTGANYNPAYGLPLFTGGASDASFGFTARPARRIRVDQYYFFDRLRAPEQFLNSAELGGRSAFNSHLLRTKINYQFTRSFSLRGILDYYAVLPNASLFNSDRVKQLTGDVLFTYLLHPGTALYFGYNNRYENLLPDPDMPATLLRTGPPDKMTNRQFFVKLSYLFRF